MATKHRAAAQARGAGVFAFDEARIFRKFDLFCKRVNKLQNMFTTGGNPVPLPSTPSMAGAWNLCSPPWQVFLQRDAGTYPAVRQFSSLAEHTHIEGLEAVIQRFQIITDDMKRKTYDLLNFTDSKFDRDLMEFEVQIHDLETQLQSFINSAFENISSTEQASSFGRSPEPNGGLSSPLPSACSPTSTPL